jgi:hypothetical protein
MPDLRWTYYLRIVIVVSCILQLSSTCSQAQNRKEKFDPDGAFWIHGQPPNEFSDFSAINLNAKRLRRLPAAGVQLNNGKNFRFKTLIVKPELLSFTTVIVAGVSFSFSGKFLKTGVFETATLDDETPVLEGTLTKFKAGKKVAEAQLKFVYFGGT